MKKTIKIKSTNKKDQIYGALFVPNKKVKAIMIICHGLGDRIDNYDEFGSIFNNQGILLAGIDMVGFGKTQVDLKKLGDFDDRKNTVQYFVEDLKKFVDELKKEYENTPIFVLGFSFGSFITRLFMDKYSDDITGVLLVGTAYKSPMSMKIIKGLTTYLANGKSWQDRSKLLYDKTMGSLNDRFEDKTIPSWLNSDTSRLTCKKDDPYLNAELTFNGYYVFYDLVEKCNTKANMKNIRKDLPIYLLCGKDDPVGNFGKDIIKINNIYLKLGLSKTKYKIYNSMRHDILREKNRDIVLNDIFKYIDKYAK